LYIQSLSRSKKDTSFASAWRASRGVVPAFCTNSAQVFSPFYPPPYTFFNSNNLQSFAILFVYFLSSRKCKNTLPLPVKAKKGCFMPSDGRRGGQPAKSHTFSHRVCLF